MYGVLKISKTSTRRSKACLLCAMILTLFLCTLRSRDSRTLQKAEKTRERQAMRLVLLTRRIFLDTHGEELRYMNIAGASIANEQRIETQLLK